MTMPVVGLESYNPDWDVQFEIEKERISHVIGNEMIRIEHIGSTSVEGLGAKPIIDIMLKEKVESVTLVQGYAESMPFETEKFDYISNNYAFHHFEQKQKALDEITRVLKKGGVYKLHNIAIHDMPNWWVYHYFPSAYYEDVKRFSQKKVIFNELLLRGFEVKVKVEYKMEEIKVADYINHGENRDISALTLISDKNYQTGLGRMRYDISENPDKTIMNDFAELFCVTRKL
ncbi:GrpB-like predicted nucleotidyltransferase (UPF0157 family) [Peribacillus cavernae]|nr:GrpB-like predicted nucleotidyltransferase (UPF0157 family) [Peribacillus cavernae]